MQRLYALIFCLIISSVFSGQTPEPSASAAPQTNVTSVATGTGAPRDYLHDLPEVKKHPVTIPKFTTVPTIDGKVDDEAWKSAAVFSDFIQTGPGNNVAPSKPTEAFMGYDEKNLYIAFKCYDEKDKIRATMANRDNVFGEDNVRLWLDTYNDQRRAYVLGFNPYGVQQDGIFTEGQGADFSVDIVMESKGVIEDWGWSVEIKIPFKSLRYSAGKGKFWGIDFARNIDRFNDEFDQWLPDDRNISGFLVKHGHITGLDEIKAERTLEIVPSVTVSETGERKRTLSIADAANNGFDPIFFPIGVTDPGKFVNNPAKQDIGVNIKYTITPNITLDAAINPDFAEIEADAPVVTANQRFPIFFQEKRPFFLEGQDIFSSPLQPFYSRTIVDPDFAAKLTGKIGKTSFGFLGASDNAPGNYSQDERGDFNACVNAHLLDPDRVRCGLAEFLGKNAYFGVLRVKRDIGKQNNVGFFSTARVFPRSRNFVGGFDGKFKLDAKTVMTFQALGTHSRKNFYNPDTNKVEYRTGNGLGYFWSLDYTTDTHGWYAEVNGRTKDYRADSGFTQQINANTAFFINRFSTKSRPKANLIRFDWQQFARYRFDWSGRQQYWLIGNGFGAQIKGSLFLNGEGGLQHENLHEDEFGRRRSTPNGPGGFTGAPIRSSYQPYFSLNLNKTVSKKLFIYGFVGSIWGQFDYDFGAGNRFPRTSLAFEDYLNSPIYQSYVGQLFQHQNDPVNNPLPNFFPDPPALDPGSGYQFDLNGGFEYKPINPLRISLDYTKSSLKRSDTHTYAYDTNIFTLRSTYQFSRFTFVRARWDYDTLNSHAAGQFLFGWNPNPGTAFYVGYNDDFNYNGFSPFTNQLEPQFERNSRTFFIRMSYLFRKSF
jgi:hypothetical protein